MRSRGEGSVNVWSRRRVLQGAASAAAVSVVAGATGQAYAWAPAAQVERYVYVGSLQGSGRIHVFEAGKSHWRLVQTVASSCPAAMVLHPKRDVLYVANQVAVWQGLPCGSVEAFAIDTRTGSLTRLSEQPLALSATMPGSLAIPQDGCHLVVAAYGGGAYNVLPIAHDGSLGRVAGIVKETGAGKHPELQQSAHPHTLVFDSGGRTLLATDLGADRLSIFRLERGELERIHRVQLPAGAGPGSVAVHPTGRWLFLAQHLHGSLATYACDMVDGAVGERLQIIPLNMDDRAGDTCSLAIDPEGRFLYSATRARGILGWKIDERSGALTPILSLSTGKANDSLRLLALSRNGRLLHASDRLTGELHSREIDAFTGRLTRSRIVANVPDAASLAIRYARAT